MSTNGVQKQPGAEIHIPHEPAMQPEASRKARSGVSFGRVMKGIFSFGITEIYRAVKNYKARQVEARGPRAAQALGQSGPGAALRNMTEKEFTQAVNGENPAALQKLRDGMQKLYCTENLDFLLAAKEYCEIDGSPEALKQKAKEIFARFVSDDSPEQINIDYQTKQKLENALGGSDSYDFSAQQAKDLFREAFDHIWNLTRSDTLPKVKI